MAGPVKITLDVTIPKYATCIVIPVVCQAIGWWAWLGLPVDVDAIAAKMGNWLIKRCRFRVVYPHESR